MWPTQYIPYQPRVDGTPPPRYYLTTPPYPVQIVEEMQSLEGDPRAGFVPSATDEEYMTSHGAPVSGALTGYGFLQYSLDERITSHGVPVSGVLKGDLVRVTAPPEKVTSYGIPLSGELKYAKVEYENWPLGVDLEDLTSHGVPISGVLS